MISIELNKKANPITNPGTQDQEEQFYFNNILITGHNNFLD